MNSRPRPRSASFGPTSRALSFGFDQTLDRSIVRKRQSMSALPSLSGVFREDEHPHTAPLFDQFFIVGANPLNFSPAPVLLMAYPASNAFLAPHELKRLPDFCFPHGFGRVSDDRYLEQFVFEIGASANPFRLFGVCSVASFRGCADAFFARGAAKEHPVCLCFLTRNPLIATAFHTLYFLSRALGGTVPALTAHAPRRAPPPAPAGALLPGMVADGGAQCLAGLAVPAWFSAQLGFFRELMPVDAVQRVSLARSSAMSFPNLAQAPRCLFYASLDLLFTSLAPAAVVHAVSLFLLERQIVFVCRDTHRLTLCLLCVRGLAAPFRYRGSFVPVLPAGAAYAGLLDAPTPFVVGVLRSSGARVPAHVCVVDLDAGTVRDPDSGPLVVGSGAVVQALEALLAKCAPLPPARPSPALYAQAVRERKSEFASLHSYLHFERRTVLAEAECAEIIALFAALVAPALEAFAALCSVTDRTDSARPVTVFNAELFLESTAGPDSAFYAAFAQTCMFQEFIERRMDELARPLAPSILVP
jgi:hypothetical protein